MTTQHVDAGMPDGACLIGLSPDGTVESWNAGAERLLGYTHDEAVGQHCSFLCTVEERRHGRPADHLDRARREETAHHVGWEVRKDGTTFWALVRLTALHSGPGTLVGFAVVVRELPGGPGPTGALDASDTAFMHDFHDTLTVVRGFGELASGAGPDDRQHFLAVVEANADRLVAMTEDLVARSSHVHPADDDGAGHPGP